MKYEYLSTHQQLETLNQRIANVERQHYEANLSIETANDGHGNTTYGSIDHLEQQLKALEEQHKALTAKRKELEKEVDSGQ